MGFANAVLAAIATLVPLDPANLAVSFGTVFASGPKRPLRRGLASVLGCLGFLGVLGEGASPLPHPLSHS